MNLCLYPGCREKRGVTMFCGEHIVEAGRNYLPDEAAWLDWDSFMEVWRPIRMGLQEAKCEELARC